jgi:hypothetical protein
MDLSLFYEQLTILSKRGLIAGPHESKEAFFQRAILAPPLVQGDDFAKLKKLYGIVPDWVKLIYSNTGLRFWEGGCMWEEGDTIVIQLRDYFRKRDKLYGFYPKREIIDHEMVHAVRGHLKSVFFEEMLAYQTSSSSLRRWLGPILQKPWEALPYMATLLLIFIFFAWPLAQQVALILNLVLLGYGIVRLLITRRIFETVKKKIGLMLGNKEEVMPFMLHLTDEEMQHCVLSEPAKLREYFEEMRFKNVHCAQIYARFFL